MIPYMETFYNERRRKILLKIENNDNEKDDLKKELEDIDKNLKNITNIRFTTTFSVKDYYDRFMKDENINFLSNSIQYIDDRKKYLSNIINKNISFSEGEDTIKEIEDILDPIDDINKFFKDTGKEMYLEDETELRIKSIRYLNNLKLEELSSGEMELLILITKIYFSSNQNSVIIFDEPEKSLHIEWQVLLGDFFKNFSEKYSETQLIVATHSPFIIQEINDKNIISINKELNIENIVESKGE